MKMKKTYERPDIRIESVRIRTSILEGSDDRDDIIREEYGDGGDDDWD